MNLTVYLNEEQGKRWRKVAKATGLGPSKLLQFIVDAGLLDTASKALDAAVKDPAKRPELMAYAAAASKPRR